MEEDNFVAHVNKKGWLPGIESHPSKENLWLEHIANEKVNHCIFPFEILRVHR